MKHAFLSLACIAIVLGGCRGSHEEPKKENPSAKDGTEEVEILEVLPEETRGNGMKGNGANGTLKTTTTTSSSTTSSPMGMQERNRDADQALIQSIRRALADDAFLARYVAIRITSNNGEVVLRGVVDTLEDKGALEKKALSIKGVKKVYNKLEVAPEPATQNQLR